MNHSHKLNRTISPKDTASLPITLESPSHCSFRIRQERKTCLLLLESHVSICWRFSSWDLPHHHIAFVTATLIMTISLPQTMKELRPRHLCSLLLEDVTSTFPSLNGRRCRINWTWIGTCRALEWQQLSKITVGLCLHWHKVTPRARNPNCEITGRSRYGKGVHEFRGWMVGGGRG